MLIVPGVSVMEFESTIKPKSVLLSGFVSTSAGLNGILCHTILVTFSPDKIT